MKKTLTKGLAWALTVCMGLTILPTTALAVGGDNELSISGGTVENGDYSVSDSVVSILKDTAMIVSGTTTTERIVVGDGVTANLTFSGVSVTATDASPVTVAPGGTLNLTLTGDNSLTAVISESIDKAALNVERAEEKTASLVIGGTGKLTAIGSLNEDSGSSSSGIGVNSYSSGKAGSVSITGGTVKAVGRGVGIGGKEADIDITGGTVTAIGLGYVTNATLGSQYGAGIGGAGCDVSVSGADTSVNAYGSFNGIGDADYWDSDDNTPLTVNISGGSVAAWSACTIGAAPDYAITYSYNYTQSGRKYGIGGGSGTISITGGTVDARGYYYGIGGDGVTSIAISGDAVVDSYAGETSGSGYGIGGELETGKVRSITISGSATVGTWVNENKNYGAIIGGGDNSGSTITIKDDSVVPSASVIGSTSYDSSTYSGYAGGTIEILGNASVGGDASYEAIRYIGGSDSSNGSGTGGAGGDITINTTGTVNATSIGGGSGNNGGAGGNITILKGTVLCYHIGGGDGKNSNGTGIGGDGGNITISGGEIGDYCGGGNAPCGSTNTHAGSGADTYYYASAGIGGGGGTSVGGDGGTINISGGTVYANAGLTVYDPTTGETAISGTGVGGAGIGGGNGADGGTINISGGNVEVTSIDISPYEATAATAAPALIGGGSAGGAGNITISGGYVKPFVYSQNAPIYGDDATLIGQGKGATDAGGWTKVTGGALDIPLSTYETTVARPVPWPVAADGSTPLYPTSFDFYFAENRPEELSITGDDEIVSLTITKKPGGETYSYGKTGVKPNSYFWLPIEEDTSFWTNSDYHELYNITVSVKKDNTVYGFSGVIRYQKNENNVGGIDGSCSLTYMGEDTETLQLTSDWVNETKTYNGDDQKPTFTVKNTNGVELTEGVDYTLEIKHTPNDGTGTPVTVTEMKNAGGYTATATGKDNTDYEGMTATSAQFWINPKHITGIYSGSFTKQYDGTTDVYDADGHEVDSIELTVDSTDLCTGDSLTGIVAQNPRYVSSGVETDIEIDANSAKYTYTQNGVACNIFNYSIDLPAITGDITVKVIGETNLDATGVTVTKVYDGTTNCTLTNVSGNVVLKSIAESEVATVNITGVSAFDSAAAGNHTVTLTIGSLAGANASNYTLAGGATTVEVEATITPADYKYTLIPALQTQEFTQGGGIAQIGLPQTAEGVDNETVTGTATLWHDEACTATQATDTSVSALTVGSHNLYVRFVPDASQTNYDTTKVTTGKVVVLTVVEGDQQELSFDTPDAVSKTYGGDSTFTNLCTNDSSDGGDVTYESANSSVAEVNESTGEVTIKGAGTAAITATAAKVEGMYRETSISYTLTVDKKAVNITVNNASRKFKEANPVFTLADPSGVLVSGDDVADLGVTLGSTATSASNVGTYDITGTSTSANYNVTIAKGTLTVNKADAPAVSDIHKNLLYSEAHTDVEAAITGLPADHGITSFAAGTVTGDTAIIKDGVTDTIGGIKFSTNIGSENQTATIPVTVEMQNYENVTVNVVVKLVNKTPVTITGVSLVNKTYDGAVAAYTGTPANEQGYTGTYEFVWSSGTTPKNAGNYTLTVKVPDDNADYMGEVEIPFEISRKAITAKPQNISIYNGAALPTSFMLEYPGLVSGDTLTPAGTPAFALKNGANVLENSSTNGTYTIEWTNKADVTLEHANYEITKANGTLTISAEPSHSGGGGSSTPAAPESTVSGSTATTKATAKTGSDGTATASVTQSQMSTAIAAAQGAAKSTGEAPRVEIQVSGASGASTVKTSMPQSAIQALVTGKMETLTLSSDVADITFDAQAIAAIAGAASGDVNISVAQVERSTLSDAAAKVVGNRPVYNFSVKSGSSTITEFGGAVTVCVPYTPAAGEDVNAIVAYYINAAGEPELMQNCRYDAKTGALVFTTTHFSAYAVGYNKITFSDVSVSAWYADAVSYLAARGITGGTSETTFSPDATLTRGQFITLLLKAYGINADENQAENFSDAGNTYYTGYLAAAKRLSITNGVGDNKFAPEQAITRQDMFTLLYNALKTIGQLPDSNSGKALSDFTDSANIPAYAQEAMAYLVKAGIVGGDNGQLNPTATTTRAQMAQVLYNLLSK